MWKKTNDSYKKREFFSPEKKIFFKKNDSYKKNVHESFPEEKKMTVTKNTNLFPLKKNKFFKKMTVIPLKYEGFPTFSGMTEKKIKKIINKNLFLARASKIFKFFFFFRMIKSLKMIGDDSINSYVKAKIIDMKETELLLSTICDDECRSFTQKDTFYSCEKGILKIREFSDGLAQLINVYGDSDDGYSSINLKKNYTENMKQILIRSGHNILGFVYKTRRIYHYGIHKICLDNVTDLGYYIKFIFGIIDINDDIIEFSKGIITQLMKYLKIPYDCLIYCSYANMLLKLNKF